MFFNLLRDVKIDTPQFFNSGNVKTIRLFSFVMASRSRSVSLWATVYTHLCTRRKMCFDPPKSPLKRGTLNLFPPFLRGVRGDQKVVRLGY